MGTTADKLNKVLQTKEAIRTSINNKGGTLTTSDKFSDYAIAIDNIQSGGGGSLKTLLDATKSCYYFFNNYQGTSIDSLISYNDTANVTNMQSMFQSCKNLTTIPQLDTSSVTNMYQMFKSCKNLTTIPQLDTSSVTSMYEMFYYCSNLTTIPQLDTSSVTNMYKMFSDCSNLTTIPQLDTSKVTDMREMFYYCSNLTTIPQLDTSKVTDMMFTFCYCIKLTTITQLDVSSAVSMGYMFSNCSALTYLKLLNVKANLQIGSGTEWGHLIEKDCLIQIISELIKPSSGTKTLTMGTANKAKIADTYVKLLADDGTGKYPFEVCASTDEGAMTIEAYCNSKNWTLA